MGYHRAGFEVRGVDRVPQPRYPFTFDLLDWREGLERFASWADVIHASPPCQPYSVMASMVTTAAPALIPEVRAALLATGKPFVIENVEGSPLDGPVMLCGTMFALKVRRHRLFEISPPLLLLTPDCQCRNGVKTGRLVGHRTGGRVRNNRTRPPHATESERRDAIGADWMTAREARQAIPPAYTNFIGQHLIRYLCPDQEPSHA